MSFGKRGQPQPTPAGRPPTPPPAAPHPSVLMRQLRGIGIGVALALGIYIAYYAGMLALGHALAAKWNAGNGIVWTAILQATEGPLDNADRQLRDACLRLHPILTKMPLPDSVRFDLQLGGSHERQLTTVGDYLACSTERMQERLCRAEERAKLVDQLRHYLKFKAIIAGGEASTALPRDTYYRMQQIVTRPASEGEYERLTRGVRALAERGYLSPGDFGFFGFGVPKELAPHLKVATRERPCP